MIEFTVPAIPIAQPRQRTRVVTANGRSFASNYTPARDPVNAFKATVRLSAEKALGNRSTILGPVKLEIVFVLPRPKNQFWKSKPMPRTSHAKKPDIDNLLKSVADALTGLLWLDDAQISECTAKKLVASGEEQPHVVVRVEELLD